MPMTATDCRESLRAFEPRMFVNGRRVVSVADEPLLAPGINAVGVTYDSAHQPQHVAVMTARQGTLGITVNRMLAQLEPNPIERTRKVQCRTGFLDPRVLEPRGVEIVTLEAC